MHEKVYGEKCRLYAGTVLRGGGLLAFGLTALVSVPASANPQGGQVSAGQASIHAQGSTLTVEQRTGRAVIDWKSFNIAPGETTRFNQPSASSAILNRIHDQHPSQILGNLSANGQVMLVNPNGMVFGKGSKVDVGGLIATTADIRNDDFMAGRMDFALPGKPNASVVNEGHITAKDAGLVGLVAPNVANDGAITARLGKVALASGDTMAVDFYGDGLVSVAVRGDIGSQLVENSGQIAAQGGTVALTAAAAREMVDSLIVNTGVIDATALGDRQGAITLYAEGSNAVAGNVAAEKGQKQGSSTVLVQGVLDASGRNPGERGGRITVTGDQVGILSGALIDASGDVGGGTIHLGGQRQGQGSTPTSRAMYVDAHSLILNDALGQGDGGETIVWSDGDTSFYGNIVGRGGAQGGNGGFAETSGHHNLTADGYVDLTAAYGKKGTYLLDPTNVTIYGNVASVFDNAGLVAGYALDEGAGTSAADSSANGNTGTLTNGPTWSSTVAPTPQANSRSISFDGTDDYVSAANLASLHVANVKIVSLWFNAANMTQTLPRLIEDSEDGNNAWSLTIADSAQGTGNTVIADFLKAGVRSSKTAPVNSVVANRWYHLVATYDGTNVTAIYLDGVSQPLANASLSHGTTDAFNIGRRTDNVRWFNGLIDDVRVYDTNLSANDVAELYGSRFTVAGIQKMSQTADVSVLASNNITLDFGGDTLNMGTAARSLTLNAGNQITTASAGTITTNNGNIALTGTNGILFNHAYILNSAGGNITFNNATTLGANLVASAGSGTLTFGSTVNGGYNLTGTAGTFSFASPLGGTTPLSAVSLTSANGLSLPSITAASITAQTTGAAADLTIPAARTLTASAANTAITLASGRNFINSAGAGALSASSGRWLIYSTNPASDTIGSLSNAFRRFTCAYGGACPSFPATGNGLLYSYMPTLTATPNAVSAITYGDAAPSLAGYGYSLSGYLGSDSSSDNVTGTLNGATAYTMGSNTGTYNLNYASGALASALGYGFSYANNATALMVNKKTLTATADDKSRVHGSPNPPLTVSYTGFHGADDATALDTAPTASTAATNTATVGTYAIAAAGGLDNNYDFTYVDGVLTVMPEHGSGGPDVIPEDTGAGGVDSDTGGEPVTGPPADPFLPGPATPTPSTVRVTLPSAVIRGAQDLTDDRRMGGDTGLWDSFFEYMAAEREDDPFLAAAPASEDAFSDDAPISILGGLVQIQPKLARLLGLTASKF